MRTVSTRTMDAALHPWRTTFRRRGDYWEVSYGGTTVLLRNAQGMRYLATLLHHPGREFHAAELIAGPDVAATAAPVEQGVSVRRSVDDGTPLVLDVRAQAAYRQRLRELSDFTHRGFVLEPKGGRAPPICEATVLTLASTAIRAHLVQLGKACDPSSVGREIRLFRSAIDRRAAHP